MKYYHVGVLSCLMIFFNSCKEEPVTPSVNQSEKYYTVEGSIFYDTLSVAGVKVETKNLSFYTDSTGYFFFDSLKTGDHILTLSHPRFRTLDTLLNLSQKVNLKFNLKLKDDSFFPLSVGNKWYYSNKSPYDTNNITLVKEVTESLIINNHVYYQITSNNLSSSLYRLSGDTLFERQCSDDKIYALFNIDNGEEFFYNQCFSRGDYNITVQLVRKNLLERILFYDQVNAYDDENYVTFGRGVGVTALKGAWDYSRLVKYEIK
ncbi:MAG: hypothetical protein WC209_14020 [Ignavibacteriaceae bacterium]